MSYYTHSYFAVIDHVYRDVKYSTQKGIHPMTAFTIGLSTEQPIMGRMTLLPVLMNTILYEEFQ